MKSFDIFLRNEKKRYYQLSSLVIIGLNILAFIFLAFLFTDLQKKNIAFWAAGMTTVSLLLYFFLRKWERADFRMASFFIIIWFYGILGFPVISLLIVVLIVLYLVAIRNLELKVSTESLRYPSFPARNIEWKELSNVLLKDGLLTIDFKNNRIIQQLIDESKTSVNEQEFNDFCRAQLKQ